MVCHHLSKLFLFIRQPFSFVTSDVVEATCQCLLAQAEDAESHKLSHEDTEGMIIGEFGRCLKQVGSVNLLHYQSFSKTLFGGRTYKNGTLVEMSFLLNKY